MCRPDCSVQLFCHGHINIIFSVCTLFQHNSCCTKAAFLLKNKNKNPHMCNRASNRASMALRSIFWFDKGKRRKTILRMDISRQVQNQHVYQTLIALVSWKLLPSISFGRGKVLRGFLGTQLSQFFCGRSFLMITFVSPFCIIKYFKTYFKHFVLEKGKKNMAFNLAVKKHDPIKKENHS